MTTLALRMLAAALLEGDDLRAAGLVDDLAGDGCTRQERSADLGGFAIDQHHHVTEGDLVARLTFEGHDGNRILGSNTVLFATGLDDCEHRSFLVFDPALAACASGRLLCS